MVDAGSVIMNKTNMRTLDKDSRINNFAEVNLGYNKEEAIKEASRCLNCPNPRCVSGCPINIQIPKFINAIKEDNLNLAYEIISEDNLFPGICGRVCPQEKQCESMCIKGFKGDAISIGSLERYVADEARRNKFRKVLNNKKIDKKVAVIGSGPSGLACAALLQSNGFRVTIYEAFHKAGGVLTYGIPNFRLPEEIVIEEVKNLENLGVKFEYNVVVGKTITLDELKEENDAIYIATGAGLPKFMGIKNECANGVFSANEILTRINLMGAYEKNSQTPIYDAKNAIVVGGGNVAMDVARSLKRLGLNVSIAYRRTREEMPARLEEVKHAYEEEINFIYLVSPKEIVVDNNEVTGIKVVDMELIDTNEKRKNVKEIENSEHIIPCDMVVMALGTTPNEAILRSSNIARTNDGLIIVDGTKTSEDKIFAGGDAVTGAATVILAMEAGKKAAMDIIEYLK